MEEQCPSCGKKYKSLGSHWSYNPSHRPPLSTKQKEIASGLIMGDGYISSQSKNPFLDVSMVNKKYLEYLDNIFGIFSKGVKLHRKEKDFKDDWKHQDIYRFRTSTHPGFNFLYNWYKTGQKKIDKNFSLSPTILKHWYVGDGNLQRNNRIRIATVNEINSKKKIEKIFLRSGLPEPDYWWEGKGSYMAWNEKGTKVLFNYMGNPLPGFEYKFPTGDS